MWSVGTPKQADFEPVGARWDDVAWDQAEPGGLLISQDWAGGICFEADAVPLEAERRFRHEGERASSMSLGCQAVVGYDGLGGELGCVD